LATIGSAATVMCGFSGPLGVVAHDELPHPVNPAAVATTSAVAHRTADRLVRTGARGVMAGEDILNPPLLAMGGRRPGVHLAMRRAFAL
jgi:hypothetical protein